MFGVHWFFSPAALVVNRPNISAVPPGGILRRTSASGDKTHTARFLEPFFRYLIPCEMWPENMFFFDLMIHFRSLNITAIFLKSDMSLTSRGKGFFCPEKMKTLQLPGNLSSYFPTFPQVTIPHIRGSQIFQSTDPIHQFIIIRWKNPGNHFQPNLGRVREIVFSTWELDMKLQGIGLQPPQLCWGSKRHMVSAAWRHPKTSRCTEKRKEVEHFWFFERNENNHTTWKIFVGRSFVFDVGVLFPFFFHFWGL